MSTISHPPIGAAQEQGWVSLLRLKEIWASLAIIAMWIAVAATGIEPAELRPSRGSARLRMILCRRNGESLQAPRFWPALASAG